MAELQRLYVRVLGDIQDLEKKMSEAERRTMRFGQQMSRVGKTISLSVTAPLSALGGVALTAALDLDRLRRGLEVSAGSAQAAARQLRDLERIARLPGLGFREAIQGAVQLNTVLEGMPDRLNLSSRLLEQFGNALALTGGGRAELDRVIMQLGQMAASGRVLTADLRPIIQTAPAVATALRRAFGTIDAQEIERMGLTTQEFFARLLEGLQSLPRAAQGPATAMEGLQDAIWRARAAVGEAMLPAVTELTNQFADWLERLREANPEILRLGVALGAALALVGPLTIGLGALTTTIAALSAAGVSLTAALLGPGALVAGVALLAGWLVKSRLDAAAFRAELRQLEQTARSAGLQLSPERAQEILPGRREALARLEAQREELLAIGRSRAGIPGISDEQAINFLTGRERELFENTERAIASTRGLIEALEGAAESAGQGMDQLGTKSAVAAGQIELTSEVFRILIERAETLRERIQQLRVDVALAAGTEEAEKLEEKLRETEQTLSRVRELLARFPTDASALAVRPDIGVSIGLQQMGQGRVEAMAPSFFEWAQESVQRFTELGIRFDDLPEDIQEAIVRAFRRQQEVAASYQRATAPQSFGAGDLGAVLSGLGGIAGGRTGGVLGGIGSALSAVAAATNPVTMAIGVFGGAVSALNSILNTGADRVRRMQEAWSSLLQFLERRFNLQDIGIQEQFEVLKQEVLAQMNEGPLRDLLASSTIETIQEFIDAVLAAFDEANKAGQKGILLIASLRAQFGWLEEGQIMSILEKFKQLARDTEQATREALLNVPQGFKIAAARFRATLPEAALGTGIGPTSGASTSSPSVPATRGGDTYVFNLHDVGQRDPRELVDTIAREIRRRKSRGGWTEIDLAFAT